MATRVGCAFFLAAALNAKLTAATCCCQEHDVESSENDQCFKGNSEDKKKIRFMEEGKTYCCKARSGGCDRRKYTIPSADLKVTPTTIEWMDEFGSTSTESAVPMDDTCSLQVVTSTTTTTTATTVTTATTTLDPHRYVDITALFGGDKVTTIKDVEYRCCCALDFGAVTCEVKEDKPSTVLKRIGCGSLIGSQYHSFLNIEELFPEFEGKEHAGKCWAKLSDLPEPVADAAAPRMVIV